MRILIQLKRILVAAIFTLGTLVSGQVLAGYNMVTFSPSTLPQGTVGNYYSQTLTASATYSFGGNWDFSITGTVPSGLSIVEVGITPNFLISGTPTTAGNFNFVISGTDAVGGNAIGSFVGPTLTGQTFNVNILSSGAPEIDGSLAPKAGFLLGCLFLMFGHKKQNTEPMLTA